MKTKIHTEEFNIATYPDGSVLLVHPRWKDMSAWGDNLQDAEDNLMEAAREYWLVNMPEVRHFPYDMLVFLLLVTAVYELDNMDILNQILKHRDDGGLKNITDLDKRKLVQAEVTLFNPPPKNYKHLTASLSASLSVMNQLKAVELQTGKE